MVISYVFTMNIKQALKLFDRVYAATELQKQKEEEVARVLKDKRCILELGVGSGSLAQKLLEVDPSRVYDGIDTEEDCIEFARDRLRKYNERVILQQMDATNLDYVKDRFDGVSSVGSLCEIGDLEKVFSESYRVLTKGGIFLCSTADFDKVNGLLQAEIQKAIEEGSLILTEEDRRVISSYPQKPIRRFNYQQVQDGLGEVGFKEVKSRPFYHDSGTLHIATK